MKPPQRESFDRFAATYDADCMRGLALAGEDREYFARGRLAWLGEFLRGRAAPARIVDLGCGTGEATALLAQAHPAATVVGLDPSAASIERAQALPGRPNLSFRHDDGAAALPGAQLVHVSGVLHHVAPAERDALLRRVVAALEPGGVLAVFENNPLNPGTRWVMSRIAFDRDAIPLRAGETVRRLQAAGLRVHDVRYLFWFPRPLAWLRPLERFLTRLPLGAQYGVFATKA